MGTFNYINLLAGVPIQYLVHACMSDQLGLRIQLVVCAVQPYKNRGVRQV